MSRAPSPLAARVLPSHLLGVPPGRRPSSKERLDYRLDNPGRPSRFETLLTAVFDNSGSLYGPVSNDPLSNRYAEARAAFAAIARRGSNHELGAVLHFDTPSSGDVEPTPLTRRGLTRLERGLQAPRDVAGTSELAPGLRRAVEIAEAHPDHAATLVVLTDLLLTDPEPGTVLSDLATFPGDVHVVVLGQRVSPGLLDERITVTHVGRQDMPGAVARALFTSLTAHRR